MADRDFIDMLQQQWKQGKFICVGLDSSYENLPETVLWNTPLFGTHGHRSRLSIKESITRFNREIVAATKDIVCAYKLNSAFYEEHGAEGIHALQMTVNDIRRTAPRVPVILDAKRADIGNTNTGYAKFAFKHLQADAITVHPYLGEEALQPFLRRGDKGIIVLCRTSNPGAGEFQGLKVIKDPLSRREPLYCHVARKVARNWNRNGNCAVVVGATYPQELAEVRRIVGDMPILIPGVGKQGGSIEEVVRAGKGTNGNMIINASRSVIFASGGDDFADAARREAQNLHDAVQENL